MQLAGLSSRQAGNDQVSGARDSAARQHPPDNGAESGVRPVHHAAGAILAPGTDQIPVYWQFYDAVARAQLKQWLPTGRHLLVDVSGPRSPAAELAAQAGHHVVRVLD